MRVDLPHASAEVRSPKPCAICELPEDASSPTDAYLAGVVMGSLRMPGLGDGAEFLALYAERVGMCDRHARILYRHAVGHLSNLRA